MTVHLEIAVQHGFRIEVDMKEPMGRVLATLGVWEPHVTAAFRALLSPGDVCVDVGANIGYNTLLAALLVGPQGHVYSLEPSPETYASLDSNLRLNGFSNVTALRLAAGAASGDAVLDDRPLGHSAQSFVRSARDSATLSPADAPSGIRVPVQPLGSVIPEREIERIRLIKIDVEGFETQVLRGLEPILELGVRPNIIVELHAGRLEEALDLLRELSEKYGLKAYKLVDDDFDVADTVEPCLDHVDMWIECPLKLIQGLQLPGGTHVLVTP